MSLKGFWYPAQSSGRFEAELSLGKDGRFHLTQSGETFSGDATELSFSDRLGNIPRKITLPDESVFQTTDNDAVDQWLTENHHENSGSLWMHSLETRWRWIGTAVLGTVVFCYAMIAWGLPWASHKIAFQLPASVGISLSDGTLATMDKLILEPSKLSATKKATIQARFEEIISRIDQEGFIYQLRFRDMPDTANAFALPSGTVVVTDRLVEILENQEQLDAILLHEIGHVVNRHSMRQVIQSSALTVALVMFTGDTSAVDQWAGALPVFLLQSQYSQGFETESDVYAFEQMTKIGIDPVRFAEALTLITDEAYKNSQESKETADKLETALKYLSSHPLTVDRNAMSKEYSERYREGL